MAETQTANYDWTKPEVGASSGTWGVTWNANLDDIDATVKAASDVADAALPRAGGTMTGALIFLAGSAGAPGLAPAGDTNTGLFSKGADQLGVACNGSEVGSFRSTGWNGNVVGNVTGDITGNAVPGASPSATAVGYLGTPMNVQPGGLAYTLVMGDAGKTIYREAGSVVVPPNSAVPFPIGTVIEIETKVFIGGGTYYSVLIEAGDGVTIDFNGANGDRNIQAMGWGRLKKLQTDAWRLTGDGIL